MAVIPISLEGETTSFDAPVVQNSDLPALWGLTSMERKRAIIDTGGKAAILPGPGGFKMVLSPGTVVLGLEKSLSGHLMMPCSDWLTNKNSSGPYVAQAWVTYGTSGDNQDAVTTQRQNTTARSTHEKEMVHDSALKDAQGNLFHLE